MEANSPSQVESEKMLPLWSGYILIVRDLFGILSEWCTKTTTWLGLFLPSMFINLLSIAFPLTLLQIYDRIIPHHSISTLVLLMFGGVAATIIGMVLSILRAVSINWTNTRFEYFTNLQIFQRLLDCQLIEFQKQGSGYYLKRMEDILSVKDYYINQ